MDERLKTRDTTGIETLSLSVRSYNCLKRNGIDTVEQLIAHTEEQLLSIQGMSQRGLMEIKTKLKQRGMALRQVKRNDALAGSVASEGKGNQPADEPSTPGIEVLDLSPRAYNALMRTHVRTVADLAALTPEGVKSIRNVGVKMLAEIQTKLQAYIETHPISSPPARNEESPVSDLPVWLRAKLASNQITKLAQLVVYSLEELLAQFDLDARDMHRLQKLLGALGLALRDKPPKQPLADPQLIAMAPLAERSAQWRRAKQREGPGQHRTLRDAPRRSFEQLSARKCEM